MEKKGGSNTVLLYYFCKWLLIFWKYSAKQAGYKSRLTQISF